MVDPINSDDQEALVILQNLGILDPDNVHSVLLLGISAQIERLEQKLDDFVRAKVWGAFESIHIAALTNDQETMRLSVESAHLLLTDCIGHQDKAEVVAWAHFGLSYLAAMRNDKKIAAYHTLRAFCADPRLTRERLAPDVYRNMCEANCRDTIAHYQKKIEKAPDKAKKQVKAEYDVWGPAGPIIYGDKKEAIREATRKKIKKYQYRCENKIDEICEEVAEQLLLSIKSSNPIN